MSFFLFVFCLSSTHQSYKDIIQDDAECEKLSSLLLNHIITKQPLPEQYQDAYKLLKFSGSGLNDMGDYYACIALPYASYYTISVSLTSGLSQEIGICYLKQCNREYIDRALKKLYDTLSKSIVLPFGKENILVYSPQERNDKYKKDYLIGFMVILFLLGIMSVLVIVGTNMQTDNKILKAFDIIKNTNAIFNVRNENDTYNHLRVFDGIRFLSAAWVVFGHCFYMPMVFGSRNLLDITYLATSWYSPFLTAAYYSVDVFFFMSGFLFYFSVQKFFNESLPKIRLIIMSIIGRYCRLLPFLIFGIFGSTYLIPFVTSGVNFSKIEQFNYGCHKNWWHNLLYINNLIHYSGTSMSEQICMGHSWYLACDMQFFLYSLLVTVIFNNYKLIQHIIYILTFIFSIEWQYIQVYIYDYTFTDMVHPARTSLSDFFTYYYIHPFARIGPYILGIYFCELFLNTELYLKDYVIPKEEKPLNKEEGAQINNTSNSMINTSNISEIEKAVIAKDNSNNDIVETQYGNQFLIKINTLIKNSSYAPWIVLLLGLVLINGSFWLSSIGNHYLLSVFWSATFNTLGKIVFIIGLGLVIHLTFLNHFNFIKFLLTFKIMSIGSRSTYGIYVIHAFLAPLFVLAYETYYYLRFCDLFLLAIGVFCVSWILALIIGLIIESPIIVICKTFIKENATNFKTKDNSQSASKAKT